MKKWKISYVVEWTEEELRDFLDEPNKPVEEVLNDYLWQELRPEGGDWDVEEIN